MATPILYFIQGQDERDKWKEPHVFILSKPQNEITLDEIRKMFPIEGRYHFRFFQHNSNMWCDISPGQSLPPYYDGFYVKALQLPPFTNQRDQRYNKRLKSSMHQNVFSSQERMTFKIRKSISQNELESPIRIEEKKNPHIQAVKSNINIPENDKLLKPEQQNPQQENLSLPSKQDQEKNRQENFQKRKEQWQNEQEAKKQKNQLLEQQMQEKLIKEQLEIERQIKEEQIKSKAEQQKQLKFLKQQEQLQQQQQQQQQELKRKNMQQQQNMQAQQKQQQPPIQQQQEFKRQNVQQQQNVQVQQKQQQSLSQSQNQRQISTNIDQSDNLISLDSPIQSSKMFVKQQNQQTIPNYSQPIKTNPTEGLNRQQLIQKHENEINAQVAKKTNELRAQWNQEQVLINQKLQAQQVYGPKLDAWETKNHVKTNIRALLCSIDEVLWEGCNWKKLSMADVITDSGVMKAYKKAILILHPDKNQKAPAEIQYISDRVFNVLNEAFKAFTSQKES